MVLSNRADLVSGGEALVQVVLPAGADATRMYVSVGGRAAKWWRRRDVTSEFAVRPNREFEGLVTGLTNGSNVLTAVLLDRDKGAREPDGDESGARITITNHPIGGPVFSGPQIQPWLCQTEDSGLGKPLDAQCDAPTQTAYFYMSTNPANSGYQPYDPAHPPTDVAMTTTDQGITVPNIVREETGTVDRGIFQYAVLYNPDKPWAPWAPQPAWNHKLYYLFGGGAAPNHIQGTTAGMRDILTQEPGALGSGFAVATGSLNDFGQNTNTVTSAETVMMVKDLIINQLGPIRFTMSEGISGGSVQQQEIAETYPGLLNGIISGWSFPDYLTPAGPFAGDCDLMERYFNETSPELWLDEAQREAVDGHPDSGCLSVGPVTGLSRTGWDPTTGCIGGTINPGNTTQEPAYVYNAKTNPGGARCDYQDYEVNVYGLRSRASWGPVEKRIGHGFANRPYDNVGAQYGLNALQSGLITPAQFVDLNQKIGGWNIDYQSQPQRSEGDLPAIERAYRSGQINEYEYMGSVPIIDLRNTDSVEFHNEFNSFSIQARLLQSNGTAANDIIWFNAPNSSDVGAQTGTVPPGTQAPAVMNQWLTNIYNDHSTLPLPQKVIQDKPAQAVDGCWTGDSFSGYDTACQTLVSATNFSDNRLEAGESIRNDIIKCQLQPLVRSNYNVTFTDQQWATLEQTFPTGVCDWNKPGVGQQPNIPWLTYAGGPGGQPLGPPPPSVTVRPKPRH